MRVALSIEGKTVKVVEAEERPKGLFIHKAFSISTDDLDFYLSKLRQRNFILAVDFGELIQETINLPPVKGKELQRLINVEMERLYPDFYFIYSDLGERIVENKRFRGLSILRVRKAEIDGLIERALNHGKNIEAIYGSPTCIATFIERSEKPLLCVFETAGGESNSYGKNIFLIKDGVILFVRKLTSFEKGLSALDIQDIEMSIIHCIQNLRIEPKEIIMAGDFKNLPESIGGLPVSSLNLPKGLHYKGEDIYEYLIPVGSIYCIKENSGSKGFLPQPYRTFRFIKNLLNANGAIFLITGILFLISGLNSLYMARSIRTDINNLLTKYRAFNLFIQSYNQSVAEAKALQSFADFLKEEKGVLISYVLKELSGYPLENIKLKSIDLNRSGKAINLRLSGSVATQSHKEMLLSFNRLLKMIERSGLKESDINIEILNKRFSPADGTFDIDIRFDLKK